MHNLTYQERARFAYADDNIELTEARKFYNAQKRALFKGTK